MNTRNVTGKTWLWTWLALGAGLGCSAPLDLSDGSPDAGTAPGAAGAAGVGGSGYPGYPSPPPGASGSAGVGTPGVGEVGSDAGSIGDAGSGEGQEGPSASAGAAYAVTTSNRLVRIDIATGDTASAVDLAGIAADDSLIGADFRPADRQLYALSRTGNLYRIDVTRAAATLLGRLAADPADTSAPFTTLDGEQFGIDFNPVVDRLRVVSDRGQNLRVNVDTVAVISDASLGPGAPSVLAAAYTNAFAAACRTRLYGIDASTLQLVVQDPPNDGVLTAIGALGVSGTLTAGVGFDVFSAADGTSRAFVLLELDGAPSLYDVDLATGALTAPRPIALEPGESVVGISAAPPLTAPVQAPGELLALTESQRLVSFNRSAPGKLCSAAPVGGLAASERLLGLDVRPLDGAVYALGSAGNVYTLDVASGVATRRSTLVADPTDTTAPFTRLTDADYGAGFNPVPDRLRAIGSGGQNLRINVDTGVTVTDAPVSASIGAVAYTNAFAGAKSTTLFGIDASADALVRVGGDPATGGACPADPGNPNCGVATAVGPLGADVSAVAGFDIDPKSGALGAAVIAISPTGAVSSSLYVLDLDTGATNAPAGVANPSIGGGERIHALTLAANPELRAYVVTSDALLVRFSPSAPAVNEPPIAITNLYEGETLIGIDRRPADGAFYAVGSSGRLYTLDPASGAARLVATLSPAAADDNPFAGFDPRASHGVDFNPAADLLRVVSDWGQNLRIVPSARDLGTPAIAQLAGATFTDFDLGPDFPALLASAYTNAFAAAPRTTLFGIEGLGAQLVRQGGLDGSPSPNGGVLTPVGPLGIAPIGDVAFDIAGGRNGVALAIIETMDTPASVYSVSLATGAATPFNASGDNQLGAGELHVTGVTLAVQ